jgi:glycerophosphoryl diester phosphodiesterase
MAAFRRAVALGATFIETDLQLTRDAQFVAIHDSTLDRTTSGRGAVKEFTLAELGGFDAGSWFGAEFAGEKIPTLAEILAFAREADVVFFLEIKGDAVWGIEHSLVNALRHAGEAARTAVLSFQDRILANVHRLDPTLMAGFLFDQTLENPAAMAVRAGARQLAPRADLVTPELLSAAHGQDLQVVTWTVNEPEHMRALADAGVNGIMTDYPDRLVSVINSR